MAVKAFIFPDEISDPITNSLLFKEIFGKVPVPIIGIHDALVSILIALRIAPKLIYTWAAIWLSAVIVLLISSMNASGLLDALEHAAPLGIALYLAINVPAYLIGLFSHQQRHHPSLSSSKETPQDQRQ